MELSKTQSELPRYYYAVDALRGIAALAVIVWHYQHFYELVGGLPNRHIQPLYSLLQTFYEFGAEAVQLFWVISGFVFASVYLNRTTTTREFVVHRFARLYPLHAITLVVVALLQWLHYTYAGGFKIYYANDLYHFVLNIFMLSSWGLEKGWSFNQPIWSVSVEIFTYLIFYIQLNFMRKNPLIISAMWVVLFYAIVAFHIPGVLLWKCGFFFFLGSLSYILHAQLKQHTNQVFWGAIVSTILLLFVGYIKPTFADSGLQHALLYPSIVLLAASIDTLYQQNNLKQLRTIGNITYGLYLWHIPIQLACMFGIIFLQIPTSILASPLTLLLFVGTSIAVSILSYRYIELPMRLTLHSKLLS